MKTTACGANSRERLVLQISELVRTQSYQVFASFIRGGDVRCWLCEACRLTDEEMTEVLIDLDNRQLELLPEKIDDIAPKTEKKLRRVFEFVKVQLRKKGVRGMVASITRNRVPDMEDDGPESVPSLFETEDDAEPVRLAGGFGEAPSSSAADLPRNWKLKLPIPPAYEKLEKISPTRLDGYLRCPFTYFLRRKDVLGDKRLDDRVEKLAAWEYGNLAHEALEAWGLSELKDSEDADAIYGFLSEKVDAQLVDRFGTAIPAPVAMQGESVKSRLRHFAAVQVARRREGWRIVAVERKLEMMYGQTRFHGKCDRIDRNGLTGEWCVIDYKTWDTAERAAAFTEKGDGTIEWKSLQLPIYCAMLDALDEGDFAAAKLDRICSCYCVLGKTSDDVKFTEPFRGVLVPSAEAKIRELVPQIERGVFWPPGKGGEWRWDYEDWLGPDPAETVDEDWLADQRGRGADRAGRCDAVATGGTIALAGFLDLVQLADHPGDRLTYRHFLKTPLAALVEAKDAGELSRKMAHAFTTRGLVRVFRELRAKLPSDPEEAWSRYVETCYADMLRCAAAFERGMKAETRLSDFPRYLAARAKCGCAEDGRGRDVSSGGKMI